MIKPRLDELLEEVDSHYACVIVAAARGAWISVAVGSGSRGGHTSDHCTGPDGPTQLEPESGR